MKRYQKPAELYDGLRLHQNENTRGCSPRVLDALAALTAEQVGFYPPYARATDACAAYLGVDPEQVIAFSAVTGEGRDELAEALVTLVTAPPDGDASPDAASDAPSP